MPEAYRKKFRNTKKTDIQSHVEFGRDEENLFDKWCQSKDIGGKFDKLRQLILIEEFKRCVPDDLKSYIDEQNVKSMQEAAVLADDYALTHKGSFTTSKPPFARSQFPRSDFNNKNQQDKQIDSNKSNVPPSSKSASNNQREPQDSSGPTCETQ